MSSPKWILLVALAALAGCMSAPGVQMAPAAADDAAKQFAPPDGKANLYIACSQGAGDRTVPVDITVDGKPAGTLIPGAYALVVVDPGRHDIQASTRSGTARLSLDAAAGKNLFYEVSLLTSGYVSRPDIGVVLIEQMGKLMVNQARLVQGP
ncbi:MAG TPA: hypothetical protein VMQ10_09990 [Spirochaetia bacterium]|nr:hypothetical protein [Spirochaetia bacterium]